jgi:hypothetical protein
VAIFGLYYLLVLYGGGCLIYPYDDSTEEVIISQNDDRIKQFLIEILSDEKQCSVRVSNHSALYKIELMVKYKIKQLEQEGKLKKSKTFFSILSISNLLVTFLVFGGPPLITITSAINSFLICFCSYTSNRTVFFFESFVIVTSFVIGLQSIFTLCCAIMHITIQEKEKKRV